MGVCVGRFIGKNGENMKITLEKCLCSRCSKQLKTRSYVRIVAEGVVNRLVDGDSIPGATVEITDVPVLLCQSCYYEEEDKKGGR